MNEYLIDKPRNELQTREWFIAHLEETGYSVVESQSPFPDYLLKDKNDKLIRVEVEYRSGNFISHGHDASECDLVLCWKHDINLRLPVFELSSMTLYEANQGASNYVIDNTKNDRIEDRFRDFLKKNDVSLSCYKKAFFAALINDVDEYNKITKKIEKPRLDLFEKQDELYKAVKDICESNFDSILRLHPYNLFEIMTKDDAYVIG